ncbi:MAG: acetylglutamate kinase [bacterium]
MNSKSIVQNSKFLRIFRGKKFVIKCGGSLLEDPATADNILDDLVLLKESGILPVLVHGGSVQADNELKCAGITPRRIRGLRITCSETLKIIERCFTEINTDTVNAIIKRGAHAVGFSGSYGSVIHAEQMLINGEDIGHVGAITRIDTQRLDEIIPDAIPVIASLGVDADGCVLNINADHIATRLALALTAEKLIFLTDVCGVMLDPADESTLISTLHADHARELIENKTVAEGMIPKVESALEAIEAGLPKVHLISGKKPHCLLTEIFTDQGCGTQIIP